MEPITRLERVALVAPLVETIVSAPLELDCAAYEFRSASIGHAHGAAVFRCTIGPVGGELLEALESVARSREMIRLVFRQRPLLLERIELERVEPGSVRISGRVVGRG